MNRLTVSVGDVRDADVPLAEIFRINDLCRSHGGAVTGASTRYLDESGDEEGEYKWTGFADGDCVMIVEIDVPETCETEVREICEENGFVIQGD